MRNYIKMFFGIYHEHSTAFGIDIDIEIWRRSQEEFDARVAELDEDVRQAGGDFTGTLTFEQNAYWLLSKDNFCDIIERLATVEQLAEYWSGQEIVVFEDSPRGTEQDQFKLVDLELWEAIVQDLLDIGIDVETDLH